MFQLYDPAAIANLAFPIGVYIDRLSAVMMVLITGVTTLIYRYSMGYVSGSRVPPVSGHARRHHQRPALHGSSANLVMLASSSGRFSWLIYFCWRTITDMRRPLSGASNTFTTLRGAMRFSRGRLSWPIRSTARSISDAVHGAAETPVTLSIWSELGQEMDGITAVT